MALGRFQRGFEECGYRLLWMETMLMLLLHHGGCSRKVSEEKEDGQGRGNSISRDSCTREHPCRRYFYKLEL